MVTISIDEIPLRVLRILERLNPGEILSIMSGEEQVIQLAVTPPTSQQLRPFGLCKGQFILPDSFFEPLPKDIHNSFEGLN